MISSVREETNGNPKKNNISWNNIIGIGITNQRETVVAWDKNTGKALTNAIVWQCSRTDELINRYLRPYL